MIVPMSARAAARETRATIIVPRIGPWHGRYRAYHRVRSLSAIYANRG